jgi:PTS system nitrogen regulatory IIA component
MMVILAGLILHQSAKAREFVLPVMLLGRMLLNSSNNEGVMAFEICDLIGIDAIVTNESANSKKQLFQVLARKAAIISGLDERQIFNTLLQRERLGSTGVGGGIAIPHGKMPALDHIQAVFVRLEQPVDYEAPDGQPVDIIFLLLVPESAGADHLKALSRVARVLRDVETVEAIRNNTDPAAIYALLTREAAKNAA